MRRREQGDDNTPLLATNSKSFLGVFQEIKMGAFPLHEVKGIPAYFYKLRIWYKIGTNGTNS